jgi:hypothetical protein
MLLVTVKGDATARVLGKRLQRGRERLNGWFGSERLNMWQRLVERGVTGTIQRCVFWQRGCYTLETPKPKKIGYLQRADDLALQLEAQRHSPLQQISPTAAIHNPWGFQQTERWSASLGLNVFAHRGWIDSKRRGCLENRLGTRWTWSLSSKSTYPDGIDCKVVCGIDLCTLPSEI